MSDTTSFIMPGERLDDLQYKNLFVIQNPTAFCFGTDAVLLANFVTVKQKDTVIDLGTGSGVIPLIISGNVEIDKIYGIEIQEKVADMARRSVYYNGLQDKIEIIHEDLKLIVNYLGSSVADVVVCNPPYGKVGASFHCENESRRIARHEVCCTLEDCVATASKLVKNGGRVAFVHQSDRITELLEIMIKYHVEPKRIRLVQPKNCMPPNLILVEGVKLAKRGVSWMPTLVVWGDDGNYTNEMLKIYHKI